MHNKLFNISARALLVVPLLPILILPATSHAEDNRKPDSSFEIEVQSPTGFFASPGYVITIRGNGRVTYRGYSNVHAKGKRHDRVSKDSVAKLAADARESGFLDLPGAYDNEPCFALDSSEGGLRIRLDGHEKSVGTCGAPALVKELMDEVNSLADVWRWVVYDPKELRADIAAGWRVSDHMPEIMDDAINWDADAIIRILVQNGADVNGLDDSHAFFLERGIRLQSVKATQALLDLGADWRSENTDSENMATMAAFYGPLITRLFLDKGVDPNAMSSAGHTMLMNAAYHGDLSTVKLLMTLGAKVNIRNGRGETALSIAAQWQSSYRKEGNSAAAESFAPVIEYLQSHGGTL